MQGRGHGPTWQTLHTKLLPGGRSREVALQVGSMNDAGVQVAWDEEANALLEGVRAMRGGAEPSPETAHALGSLLRQVQAGAAAGGRGASTAFGGAAGLGPGLASHRPVGASSAPRSHSAASHSPVGASSAPRSQSMVGESWLFAGGVHVPIGGAGRFVAQLHEHPQPHSYAPSAGLSGDGVAAGASASAETGTATALRLGISMPMPSSSPVKASTAGAAAANAATADVVASAHATPAHNPPAQPTQHPSMPDAPPLRVPGVGASHADWADYLGGAERYPGVDVNLGRTSDQTPDQTTGQTLDQASADVEHPPSPSPPPPRGEWEVPAQLRAVFAGAPPVPAHAAWAASLQQRSVDGLLRAQVSALRLRLRTAVRRAETTRYHSLTDGGGGGAMALRPSSATAASTML